jgi:hypothetical protein
MSEPRSKDLTELERHLAALSPKPATLDRDRLLFRAGRDSMRRHWAWPTATAVMALACVGLTLTMMLRSAPEPIVRVVKEQVIVYVSAPESVASVAETAKTPVAYAPGSPGIDKTPALPYWQMHQQVLRFGVDGLPVSALESDEKAHGPVPMPQNLSVGSRPQVGMPFTNSSFGEP